MCGIAGFALGSASSGPEPDLLALTRRLTHRGPDSEGFYREPGLGLGMRRLRVIDLETGEQPIANETGDVQVVYNGEIYNFQELRRQLESHGHRFKTRSDTEVLVHGWEEWGEELPQHLRGMFAFALWDRSQGRLFVARDHFGIKPLYYVIREDAGSQGDLLFASEIKAIFEVPGVSRDLDVQALDAYLSFLYIPEPRTIYQQVRALPPGHALSWRRDGGVEIREYYRPQPRPQEFPGRAAALEEVREVFEDSVRSMLVADVPVGLFLSAGIDSASILAMMARHSEEPVRTFTIGFGEEEHRWDELAEARRLAELFHCEHHEIRVNPDIVTTLPEVARQFDQPFANPTALILHLLSGEARRRTTVALSGTGGDELFAGYPRYRGMQFFERYRMLPASLRRGAGALVRRFLPDRSDGRLFFHRARRFLEGGALPFDRCYARFLVILEDERKRTLYSEDLVERLAGTDTSEFLRQGLRGTDTPLEHLLTTDISTYLPFNQLTYGDRMSMAQSLEIRVPFVDQRVAEVAATIPLGEHLRGGVTKGLFREAMAPFLPQDVLQRSKLGLNLPIALWFRGSLRGWMEELLSVDSLTKRRIFRPEAVQGLVEEHRRGFRDHSLFLWALVVLELWFRDLEGEG